VDFLVQRYEQSRPPAPPVQAVVRVGRENLPARFLQVAAEKLLDNVRAAADGEKHNRLNRIAYVFGGYVESGYYEEGEVKGWLQDAARSLPNVRNLEAAFRTIDAALQDGRKAPLRFEREYAVENVL
jgi:hypothetical protein